MTAPRFIASADVIRDQRMRIDLTEGEALHMAGALARAAVQHGGINSPVARILARDAIDLLAAHGRAVTWRRASEGRVV